MAFFAILFSLLVTFFVVFLPRHLVKMQKRAVYYLWGKLDAALPGRGYQPEGEGEWVGNWTKGRRTKGRRT